MRKSYQTWYVDSTSPTPIPKTWSTHTHIHTKTGTTTKMPQSNMVTWDQTILIKVLKLRPVHWQILWNWKYCQCLLLWWTWSQADVFQSHTSQRWWCWLQNHLPPLSTFPMAALGVHQRLCGLKCPGAVKHLLSLQDWSQEWSSGSWLLLWLCDASTPAVPNRGFLPLLQGICWSMLWSWLWTWRYKMQVLFSVWSVWCMLQ